MGNRDTMRAMLAATLAGLAAGLIHVLSGPDHLAAVAPLAGGRGRAWRAGFLWGLGHSDIAIIKGQSFTPDSEVRWKMIAQIAAQAGRPISSKLVVQLEDNLASPDLGYHAAKKLFASGRHFTAVFAFNDLAAIGSMRAVHEHGLRVPQDVSIVGFDDIDSAAYQNPPLTTVRQPLKEMGRMAAQTVLSRIGMAGNESQEIVVEPELVVRATTAPARAQRSS